MPACCDQCKESNKTRDSSVWKSPRFDRYTIITIRTILDAWRESTSTDRRKRAIIGTITSRSRCCGITWTGIGDKRIRGRSRILNFLPPRYIDIFLGRLDKASTFLQSNPWQFSLAPIKIERRIDLVYQTIDGSTILFILSVLIFEKKAQLDCHRKCTGLLHIHKYCIFHC